MTVQILWRKQIFIKVAIDYGCQYPNLFK